MEDKATDKPEQDGAKDDKTKWASEAYAFLALYRHMGRRIPGLLLMELGWAILLSLASRFGAKDAAATIGWPTFPGVIEIPISVVYTVGALILLAIWVFTSGFY